MATKNTAATTVATPIDCRLRKLYKEVVVPQLVKEFGYEDFKSRL